MLIIVPARVRKVLESIASVSVGDIEEILYNSEELLSALEKAKEFFSLNVYSEQYDVTIHLYVDDKKIVYVGEIFRGNIVLEKRSEDKELLG